MRIIRAIFVLLLLAAVAANLVGCNLRSSDNRDNGATDADAAATVPNDSDGEKNGENTDSKDTITVTISAVALMDGIIPAAIEERPADRRFITNIAELSIDLFKKSVTSKENSLISPLSVIIALSLTANGADGETLAQMEKLLGGGIPLDELNEYELKMNDTLAALGMPDAFDDNHADFSKMGKSPIGNLYISEVIHKTYISVDERGTRAGAVTTVGIEAESGPAATIRLDRPFIYAIIDDSTNLPIFIGTVLSVRG